MENKKEILTLAQNGDINAFQKLFAEFQDQLKSYLFRMTASRADAEDLAHDTFIQSFDKVSSFKGQSSLKTWVFRIGTNLAYNLLGKRKRWSSDVSQKAKDLVQTTPQLAQNLQHVNRSDPHGSYEIKEHIDTCFTCTAKVLSIDNQIAVLLKDLYDFTIIEIQTIMGLSQGQVKYLLQRSRSTMSHIFESKCALINKNGSCHQCSELNGWFNPKQDQYAAKLSLKMTRQTGTSTEHLFWLRTELVKAIDPLTSPGHALQEQLLNCNRLAMKETS